MLAWLQPLEMSFYFIQHACIASQLIHEEAQEHLPQLTNAMSIMFLVILVSSVLYSLVFLIFIFVIRNSLVSPEEQAVALAEMSR